MTDPAVTMDTSKLDKLIKMGVKVCDDPGPIWASIGLVLRQGIKEQFTSAGSHWGTPWTPGGYMITRIREWQGLAYDPNKPLIASGELMRNWVMAPLNGDYKKGMVFGSPFPHARNMQLGIGGVGVFPKRSGGTGSHGGHAWTFAFPLIHAREIIPVTNGFTEQEYNAFRDVVHKHFAYGLGIA